VEQINQLAVDYGLPGVVVCSRLKGYTALAVRLQFNRAIVLQPLSPEQLDAYFDRAGPQLAGLRTALQRDEALHSLAQSPLMLNIMSLAYQDRPAEALSTLELDTDDARRRYLFDTYIARMFTRKGDRRPYDADQTKARLAWLARNMQRHNQEVFLIEGLQPSWLPARRWRIGYILASRLLSGLSVGLIFGLIFGQSGELVEGPSERLFFVLLLGLLFGLPISFIDLVRLEWLDKWQDRTVVSPFWWTVINIAIVGLSVGLLVWLVFGQSERLLGALIYGLIGGLIFGLRGRRQSLIDDIQMVEALRWSGNKTLKGGLSVGLSVGLIFWLSVGPEEGLSFGLIFWLLGVIFSGLSREIIETKTTPNQGIRLSVRYAIFGGLVGGLIFLLFFGLGGWLAGRLGIGLNLGLIAGLIVGLLGALWYGGLDIIQHYTLRLILIIQGHTPRHYARFLDHAAGLIFLQKVGGGYRFIHRLLLEHFVAMDGNGE
jgi:hypothetical protein